MICEGTEEQFVLHRR